MLYCLLPAKEITRVTKTMRGTVFFSATLTPLPAMKQLLGGGEEDACFSLPSPFPPSHLAVVRRRVSTRYLERENSAETVAASIAEAVEARPGKYIAYFPSYAYLRLVLERLDESALPPLWVQQRDMGDEDRENFLTAFEAEETTKLGLCVLGGLFSEGIDLPGDRLVGVIVVGVGLPTPSQRLRAIQACYARHFGDGFAYACRIPAMHKVLQAGGRVIRTDEDRGLILLLDERYYQRDYEALLPPEWHIRKKPETGCERIGGSAMKNSGRPLLRMLCVTLGAIGGQLAAPAGTVGEEKTGESKGILYRVTGGNSEMFLLGSIHVGSEEMYPMNRRITDALAAADTMVFECDTESPDVVRKMASMMSYPKGETLREHISAECYALLEQAAGKTGYPIGMLNALRPGRLSAH